MKTLLVIGVIILGCLATWFFIDYQIESHKERKVFTVETKPLERVPSNNNLVEIYDGVSVSPNTRKLDLSNRSFTGSLKAEIRMLTELEELDLSGNEFTGLPAEVGQLHKLKVLDLSNNPLTGLPHELGNLRNLELLDLSNTSYATFDLDIISEKLPPTTVIKTE